jgi:hypothetical protein
LASYTVDWTGAPGLCVHNMCAHRRPARPAPTITIRGFADARDDSTAA